MKKAATVDSYQRVPTLERAVIFVLSQTPSLSADELAKRCERIYRTCSIQALYKVLRNLEERGIVLSAKHRYGLTLSWILQNLSFLERAYRVQTKGALTSQLIPSPGEKFSWTFRSLERADSLWVQVMLASFEASGLRDQFVWLPHPFFHLSHHEKELKFQDAQRFKNKRLYLVVGGQTPLDSLFSSSWPDDTYTHSMAHGPFQEIRTRYFSSIGDIVATMSLQKSMAITIDEIFETLVSFDQITAEVMSRLKVPTHVRLTVERSPGKAARMQRQFREYFGV